MDPLALVVSFDGALVLGASGYDTYDDRDRFAAPEMSSVITTAWDLAAPSPDRPPPTIAGDALGATATLAAPTSPRIDPAPDRIVRAVTLEDGAVAVRDTVYGSSAGTATWHWHLRGTLDASTLRWTVGTTSCAMTTGDASPPSVSTAATADVYGLVVDHPVVRYTRTVAPGSPTRVVTTFTCGVAAAR